MTRFFVLLFVAAALLGASAGAVADDSVHLQAQTKVRQLIAAAKSFEGDSGVGSLQGMNDAGRLARELATLGAEHPDVVVPQVTSALFHPSSFARIYLMEALLGMKEASAAAYPYVRELLSVDIEPGPFFRYQRWLAMPGIRPSAIPLEVKVSALRFSARNEDAFLRTRAKEAELIDLGKKHQEELERLLRPLQQDESSEVSASAGRVLAGIR